MPLRLHKIYKILVPKYDYSNTFLCRAKNYADTSSYVIKESPFDSIRTLIAVHKCNDTCSRQNLASDAAGE